MISKNFLDQEIGIIIPAYNPDSSRLLELLIRLENNSFNIPMRILIVDDGSDSPVVLPKCRNLDLRVYRHPQNLGKGAALKTGFHYFFSERTLDLVITMDADLQHPPEKIHQFIQYYQEGKGQIIIGYRKRSPYEMPLSRIFSNTITSLVISAITGQLVRDSQCGFRLIERNSLKNIMLKETRFHLESEMLILLGLNGVRFGFVEIPTIYDYEKSSINHVRDTLNFIQLIIRILKERIIGYV